MLSDHCPDCGYQAARPVDRCAVCGWTSRVGRSGARQPIPPVASPIPEDYCAAQAVRRWIRGDGPLKALMDEEYATALRDGKLDLADREAHARFQAAWSARQKG